MYLRSVLTSIALLSTTGWAQYVLEDDYLGDGNFFDQFSFFQGGDPTHGSVNYVDRGTANNGGLIHLNNGQVYMGVDHTNFAPAGRASVRITSNKAYNSGLVILDLAHMPGGICGTWPAFWMVGSNWPNNGEIDIIEGVNDQTTNDMTLHTSDGCKLSSLGSMLGSMTTSNCYVNAPGQYANQGCVIGTSNTLTYGTGFNNNGGGVYATEWTSSAIKIYFFPRGAIPSDIAAGKPNPASWGSPMAFFQGCDMPNHFKNNQLVFDTTFCGDWAGAAWAGSSCSKKASTCESFVANNPSAFADAYWLINSLKVYQGSSSGNTNVVNTPVVTPTTTKAQVPTTSSTTPVTTSTSTTHSTVAVPAVTIPAVAAPHPGTPITESMVAPVPVPAPAVSSVHILAPSAALLPSIAAPAVAILPVSSVAPPAVAILPVSSIAPPAVTTLPVSSLSSAASSTRVSAAPSSASAPSSVRASSAAPSSARASSSMPVSSAAPSPIVAASIVPASIKPTSTPCTSSTAASAAPVAPASYEAPPKHYGPSNATVGPDGRIHARDLIEKLKRALEATF